MSVAGFSDLLNHVGHPVEVVCYGVRREAVNVAVECTLCGEVLIDYDRPEPFPEPATAPWWRDQPPDPLRPR